MWSTPCSHGLYMSWAEGMELNISNAANIFQRFCTFVTGSAKRGLIAFLNFQLQLVTTHGVFSLLM